MDEFFQKLEKYYELLYAKDRAEHRLTDEETYMKRHYPKPILKLKEILPLGSLTKLKIKLYALWGGLILSVIITILSMLQVFGIVGYLFFGIPGLLAVFILPCYAIITTREFKEESSEKEKLQKQNEENELWNQAEYRKLKEYEKQFEESYSERKIEYEKSQIEAKKQLEEINSELKNYADFVPEDYVPEEYIDYLDNLLEIAQSGRAYSLSEAIEIFELESICESCIYARDCRKFGTPDCPSYVPRQR